MIFTKFIKMCIERARKNQTFRGVVGSYCVRLHVAYISTNMICTNVFDILADLVLQVARPGTQMQWCAIITGVVTASLAESKLLRFFKAMGAFWHLGKKPGNFGGSKSRISDW